MWCNKKDFKKNMHFLYVVASIVARVVFVIISSFCKYKLLKLEGPLSCILFYSSFFFSCSLLFYSLICSSSMHIHSYFILDRKQNEIVQKKKNIFFFVHSIGAQWFPSSCFPFLFFYPFFLKWPFSLVG